MGRHLCLRFISGKYQGGEFPLLPEKEIRVGRSNDLEMVLTEDMVSRRHARIVFENGEIHIEDLNSTNGTFVNGERISRAIIREGDRVLIGTSILKVVASDSTSRTTEEQARRDMAIVAARRRTAQTASMSGSIEEIPLPDLLQLLGTSKKSGVLVIRNGSDVGRIYLQKGLVNYVTVNDAEGVSSEKNLFRMLNWPKGSFDLEAPDNRSFENPIDMPVQALLMEGMRQHDELARIKDQLPSLSAKLLLEQPIVPLLRDLLPDELDIIQSVVNFGVLETVINHSAASDLQTAQTVLRLIDTGYVRVEQ